MPSLTNGEIRRALKQVEESGKQLNLIDGEGHGTGRLVLVMKPMPTRVTADRMAPAMARPEMDQEKLGSYPAMSLSTARNVFDRDFAHVILKGRNIKIAGGPSIEKGSARHDGLPRDRRDATPGDAPLRGYL
ncbi:hypothetical protein [Sinorhizobium garamanticum]|uniref:hypothetical protein n=1 Tax=Sinorhizobium garamanticum TaxID=680247 RepID=UPI003CC8D6BB